MKFPASVVNVVSGPTVTRFELQPQPGISLKKILNFDKDLEYTLACGSVRIEAPIAGKRAIGIEVANTSPSIVTLREVVDSKAFVNNKAGVPLAIGKDIGGDVIVKALEGMPHLLVAGATGMGKSVCLNAIIMSLIYKLSPEDIRLILVDPKQVEFMPYRDLPHMLLRAPIVDVDYTINAFDWLIEEMERRFEIFNKVSASGYNVRQLKDYNETDLVKSGKAMKMPRIVMIVDELADLMTIRKKDIETRIRRLAAKSRAAGINLILATQRPSVDVITGTIKANIPSRIAFKVTSYTDSQTILDHKGAEALLGHGDLLYVGDAEPHRIQGAFVSNEEISAVMDFVKKNNETCFDEEIEKKVLYKKEADPELVATADDRDDADEKLFPEIMRLLIEKGSASTSFIQCRFRCGYGRATRIVENLEMRGWIGPSQGARPREVYMTRQQFEEIFSQDFDE